MFAIIGTRLRQIVLALSLNDGHIIGGFPALAILS
jgi:hypothetical protein